jgi:hypothetical protein
LAAPEPLAEAPALITIPVVITAAPIVSSDPNRWDGRWCDVKDEPVDLIAGIIHDLLAQGVSDGAKMSLRQGVRRRRDLPGRDELLIVLEREG